MEPTLVKILTLPEPTMFHIILNFGYAVVSGIVGGCLIFYLNRFYMQKDNKEKYKDLLILILTELYYNHGNLYVAIRQMQLSKIHIDDFVFKISNWENRKIDMVKYLPKKLFRDLEITYSELRELHGKNLRGKSPQESTAKYVVFLSELEDEFFRIVELINDKEYEEIKNDVEHRNKEIIEYISNNGTIF